MEVLLNNYWFPHLKWQAIEISNAPAHLQIYPLKIPFVLLAFKPPGSAPWPPCQCWFHSTRNQRWRRKNCFVQQSQWPSGWAAQTEGSSLNPFCAALKLFHVWYWLYSHSDEKNCDCALGWPWNNRICTVPALKLAHFYHGPQAVPEANKLTFFFQCSANREFSVSS